MTITTTVFNFIGPNGYLPTGSLIADTNGDLFGTTDSGGANGKGNVFEITKASGSYAASPTTLVSFNGAYGTGPDLGLLIDAQGDLFGTTHFGGANSEGSVFEIVNTGSGYASNPTTLVSFGPLSSDSGANSGLIADASGNLLGVTNGFGSVYEVVKTPTGYATPETWLSYLPGHAFGNLVADTNGNLFGTTYDGGASGKGTVFEVAKTAGG